MRYIPFSLFFLLLFLLPLCGDAQEKPPVVYGPQIQQTGPHNTISIRTSGEPGHYTGFDVFADDKLVAPVRFTSCELLYCPTAVATNKGLTSTLVFDGLLPAPDCGLSLKQSRIVVTLQSQQFPTIAFDLNMASFSPRQWQATIGAQPFHFLTIGMPDATVWHQQGWLNATPRADLFPLLLDVHNGTPELSSYTVNREWSHTPPLSAHPLPVIGLWSPAQKLYAGWDFQAARLTDHSERDIATGFCNRLIISTDPTAKESDTTVPPTAPVFDPTALQSRDGRPLQKRDPRSHRPLTYLEQSSRVFDQRGVSKFVALVYPSGGTDARQLVYPDKGAHIASHATLVVSADLSDTDDPNRLLWQTWWNTPDLRKRLPHAPHVNAPGRLPESLHIPHLPVAPEGSLLTGADATFQIPGSLLLSGRGWHNENAVDAPARNGDKTRLAQLQSEARTLLKYARHFTVAKEPCVYWEQPLVGEWLPEWGGEPVTTLHNANGWAAGRLLLDLYRLGREEGKEEEKRKNGEEETITNPERLNTRTPEHQTPNTKHQPPTTLLLPCIDGVCNWTKHVVWTRGMFPNSPASASAQEGTLAVAFLLDYYVTFKDDRLDTERRSRALQALELARVFAYRYMILWTGEGERSDERGSAFSNSSVQNRSFVWAAQAGQEGMQRASLDDIAANLDTLAQVAVYTGDPILIWALRGSLARYASPGDTTVRVLCGEQAAMAFDGSAQNITISNYRCTGMGDFAFTLHRSAGNSEQNLQPNSLEKADTENIGVTVTFPYADLSRKPVAVRHGSITQRLLQPGTEILREPNALWSLIVRGVGNGDTLIVGKPDLASATKLKSE